MVRPAVAFDGNPVNGHAPPQSTLAAQIVQNQAGPAPSQHEGGSTTFHNLLHEILHSPTAEQETDVNVNAQLVGVVLQAGLLPLTRDNPFADWDALLPQARDSIEVLRRTIARQPDVLLAQLTSDGPQLMLSMLTSLLGLCGRPRCEDLAVGPLLGSAVQAFESSLDLWQLARTLQEILQECVDDLLSALEALQAPKVGFHVNLPSARSISKLWPRSDSSIALPEGSQATIDSAARAFWIALLLSQVSRSHHAWQREAEARLCRVAPKLKPMLVKADVWERCIGQLLYFTNNASLLETLVREAPRTSSPTNVQIAMAKAMIDIVHRKDYFAVDRLMPAMRALAKDPCWNELHQDLKIAVTTWLCRYQGDQLPEQIVATCNALRRDDLMIDNELKATFERLSMVQTDEGRRPRRKRRKVSTGDLSHQRTTITARATTLLTRSGSADAESLSTNAPWVYRTLPEADQCKAWQCLAELAEYDAPTALETVSRLIELARLHESKRARTLSVLAVRACILRTDDPQYLALGKSEFGKYCLASLTSSVREVRVAGGQTLSCFLRQSLPDGLRTQNRQLALEYLRSLSDRDVANEQETLILAWGQVAVSCGDSELNLVLLRLVDYLGHRNILVNGLAYIEIENIADAKKQSVKELFQPFWRSVAVSVVQDLLIRPQKTQQLCDLLSMDVNAFLSMTQRYTLPVLVLTKKKEILQRIANARGGDSSILTLCTQPRTHLAAILALLLTQSSAEPEETAFACLTEADSGFAETDLAGLIKLDPALVACEMLKHCGDESEGRRSRAYQAFQLFANIEQAQPGHRKAYSKSSRAVSSFFERHLLGILTLFSTSLEDSATGAESDAEKIRCLRALSELFTLAKGDVSVGLPQIRACLQSGLEQKGLCEAAFGSWMSLIPLLQSHDIASIVDETFVLVVRHWHQISPEMQHKAYETIGQLVKAHNKILQENIMTLPSLAGIPLLSKFAAEFDRLKGQEGPESHCKAFTKRLKTGGDPVVLQALTELVPFLEKNQSFVHDTAASEHPSPVLADLLRALLDTAVKYSGIDGNAAESCAKALGLIGSLDPNRIEANRKKRRILVLSNFDSENDTVEWVMALFEDVLVKAFKSVTNARTQGFLAYTMQELLSACRFNEVSHLRPRASQGTSTMQRWTELPEQVRTTLTPFLTSRYVVTSNASAHASNRAYPSFSPEGTHSQWLRSITYDLMFKGKGDNAQAIFPLLARTLRGHDLAIARFVFPYAVLNVVVGGTVTEVQGLTKEFMAVLQATAHSPAQQECIRLCSESVFAVLDYLNTWLLEKRKELAETRTAAYKTGVSPDEFAEARDMAQIDTIETFLASIPAEVIANQAVECRSYARALFHWEQYIRAQRSLVPSGRLSAKDDAMYDRLQDIYSQIDEPDGLEGIAAHLPIISDEQQAFNHAKAGRWTAAQAWYELRLADDPADAAFQLNVLRCLRETGQYGPLLRYADSFLDSAREVAEDGTPCDVHLPMAAEACWMTEDYTGLERRLTLEPRLDTEDFNIGIGQALLRVTQANDQPRAERIKSLRRSITEGMSMASTDSLSNCHEELVKLHALHEFEALATVAKDQVPQLLQCFDKRLTAIGSYHQDKQYILGIRRAVMSLRTDQFRNAHTGSYWLTTARLARQAKNTTSAYNAVLKAYECGERGAKLEEARLLWHEGHQRQAIQSLEAAIESGVFDSEADPDTVMFNTGVSVSTSVSGEINGYKQDMLLAKALLLLAKWLDASGQSQTKDMTDRYQLAARRYQRWEKGHYYLGKHYSKLLDAQKALPKAKQSQSFLTGELTKLVIDNSLRSIPFGNKYWHETIPRILTLWLELGTDALQRTRQDDQNMFDKRVKNLQACNRQLQKYFERVPAYVFYHALPQLISRITHPHPEVWRQLCMILTRIASTHPSQALWSLLAVVKAKDETRVERGTEILNRLKDPKNKPKNADIPGTDLRNIIMQGQRLCDGLLQASEHPVEPRAVNISLGKHLAFNHKLAPSHLVVPIEATLTASAPGIATSDTIRRHKAFTQERITIQAFMDDVLVLNSLQRPRKITVRGSDGKLYGLLCKPKDDLRKDQRLMEFNGIINRALKRNTESSKRRLYIKTYAVTPLSEESGTIEWVEGIKPIRDILLAIYGRKGIRPNYNEIKKDLDTASSAPEHAHVFRERVLKQFPASLHEWFTETYPEPDVWMAARLRYARSAAVMSMTGHILGLGDRHGENILLEESTGGVFHVDFNCLFDKGLTFEKPELVPFRLTHNMVDAMGAYGHEGPFRKSCELTLGLLRQERDTLMTVLETFLYDPTTDFVGKKKRTTPGVPETPAEILESVATKLKGLLRGETVPLSVEGYVDALIQEATSHFRLASMYIGWCSFL